MSASIKYLLPLVSISLVAPVSAVVTKPTLTLAKEYHSGIDLAKYWVCEKFDGIRALWTGTELVTRSGTVIHPPQWFIESLPKNKTMEGELWAGRGQFNLVQQTVLDSNPDDKAWRKITWMVFDMPTQGGNYRDRYSSLKLWVDAINDSHIRVVPYQRMMSQLQLSQYLETIEKAGGEGLILRQSQSHYQSGRSDSLLKFKRYQDAEAVVIGYKAGKGRLAGKTGALKVKNDQGEVFYLGSGLSDDERRVPPALGSRVTYRYNGLTAHNKPRFARFLRVRSSAD